MKSGLFMFADQTDACRDMLFLSLLILAAFPLFSGGSSRSASAPQEVGKYALLHLTSTPWPVSGDEWQNANLSAQIQHSTKQQIYCFRVDILVFCMAESHSHQLSPDWISTSHPFDRFQLKYSSAYQMSQLPCRWCTQISESLQMRVLWGRSE